MARQVVFLVHGMGKNPAAGENPWFKEVVEALDKGWKTFDSLKAHGAREEFVEFVPINYDHVFTEYLTNMQKNAEALSTFLPTNQLSELFEVLDDAGEDENFFWDDVFDVIFYRFGGDYYARVHTEVVTQIVDAVNRRIAQPNGHLNEYSMIAHSLGTAVSTGSLNRLGGGEIANAYFRVGNRFHLRTFMALANVSNLLWWGTASLYDASIVRPNIEGATTPGYVDKYISVRNMYDPFPFPAQFSPSNWGTRYFPYALRHVHRQNVHAYTHYLAHPRVIGSFYQSLLGARVLPSAAIEMKVAGFDDFELVQATEARAKLRALAEQFGKDMEESYAGGGRLLPATIKLIGRALRDVWRLRKQLSTFTELPA